MNKDLTNLINLMSGETSVHDSYVSTIVSALSKHFNTTGLEERIAPLPEHVLQLIVSAITAYDVRKYKSYNELFDVMNKYGLLDFKPIITFNSKGVPAVVLNFGKFLMPVGTTFALVSDIEQMTALRESDCDFGFLINDLKHLSDTGLWQTLFVAIAYQLVATDNNLQSMGLNGIALLYSFGSKCMDYYNVPRKKPGMINSLRLNVCKSIDMLDDVCLEDDFAQIGIYIPDRNILAQLRISDYYILVITDTKVVKLGLQTIVHSDVKCLKDNHYLQILSLFALNAAGCSIGWNTEFTNGESDTVFTIGGLDL